MSATAMSTSVGALIGEAAQRFGDKTALVFDERNWSFRELDDASSMLAAALLARGLRAGDTVSLYSPNCPEWIIGYYAVLKLGGIVNPLNLMLTPDEAAYAMNDCGAVAVLGSHERIAGLARIRVNTKLHLCVSYGGETPPGAVDFNDLLETAASTCPVAYITLDQPCTVAYTSGTTGHPKGALLTHRSILMNTAMTATMHVRSAADTVVSALPCSHVYGNIVMNAAIAYGMTLVLHPVFDAERVLDSIQTHRATLFEGVPTMYMYLLNFPRLSAYDLSSLSRCTVGGQTMPEAKMRDVEAVFGCPLIELWGMTELGGLGTTHSAYGPTRHGSIGIALPHLEARVIATDGARQVLPAGSVGELQIRGPVVMAGYLCRPDATADAIDPDGWLHTGDLVRQDQDGYLYVVDRLKDMIITGGFNIYPAELERVIAEHPDVALVAVGSVVDDVKGELAKAYIVPRHGAQVDLAALEAHCRARLAAYKVPRVYQIVEDLPKTSTGKILRRMLHTLEP
ncbi:AMP-dependent synthetase and ligase [Pseudomonas sp. JV551A1]|uniref:AMP-dependent synthetase and ligase n=1 Tax=Pseudomonas inefficax TaxID=2078786 RepID=A0AAQ1SVA6_9PSED|nr:MULTISPECIES: AMP-binding protein [Pseudomonas]SPO54607.1 AMP-dependent synthetase and ligase [Pseudomonas sp. JV551A1]SPO62112.1 AMP-dependent synthetase and ligase [Pseudomonas inefficax]